MAIDPAELVDEPESEDRLRNSLERELISALRLGPAISVQESATLQEAVENLQNHHIGCVLISGENGTLEGIFTERDLLNRVAGKKLDWSECRVSDFMTRHPETLRLDDRIVWALNLMHMGGYRHVPLVDEQNRPVGVISVKDIVEFIVELMPGAVLNLPPDPHRLPSNDEDPGGTD
ncbi:MAG TPA: CBS domain-containing protein [Myxococcales bacterium]|nr:CBS domain-containing protein [Myxococcales bacterium]